MKDWQHHLDVRERKLDDGDEGLSKLMRELRVKETTIVDKDAEIRMKKEIDNSVLRAREEVQREIEVGVCCVVLCL